MRLNSFHSDVIGLLMSMRIFDMLTCYPKFLVKTGTQAEGWLAGKIPSELLIYDSLNLALDACNASQNDMLIIAPGYYEDIGDTSTAGALDVDVADLSVIGLGRGESRPRFDFNHADADFLVGAANILLKNLRFVAAITGVKLGISVEANGDQCAIDDCSFTVTTTTTDEFLSAISFAAGANYGEVKNCRLDMGLGGATSAIELNGAVVGTQIKNNYAIGDYSTAVIEGATAASTLLDIGKNILVNGDGADLGTEPCIELTGNATGVIYDNYCVTNLATKAAAIVAAKCLLFNNYYNEDISGAGTGGLIGTASADD